MRPGCPAESGPATSSLVSSTDSNGSTPGSQHRTGGVPTGSHRPQAWTDRCSSTPELPARNSRGKVELGSRDPARQRAYSVVLELSPPGQREGQRGQPNQLVGVPDLVNQVLPFPGYFLRATPA